MIKTILALIAMMTSAAVFAQKIYMPIPFSAGGSIGPMVPILAEGLTKKGWTVDYKMIGSCGPVKETFEKSEDTIVTVWGSGWQTKDHTCRIEYTPSNFVNILQQNSLYFCGPKNDLTFKLVSGKTYTVAVNTYNNTNEIKNIETVAKKFGATLKFVTYKNSGAIRTAYEAKEVDAIYSSIGLAEHNKGQSKCLFTNAETAIDGIPNIGTLIPNVAGVGETFIVSVLTNNKKLTAAQAVKLKSNIKDILDDQPVVEYLKTRYIQRYSANPDQQLKFIQDRLN
jgi:hypothetical protein